MNRVFSGARWIPWRSSSASDVHPSALAVREFAWPARVGFASIFLATFLHAAGLAACIPSPQSQPAVQSSAQPDPFRVSVVYSPDYLINLGGLEQMHPFDIKKYQKIHEQLKSDGLLTDAQTWKPDSVTDQDLLLVHRQQYLADLKVRTNIAKYLEAPELVFAPVSLERAVLEPFKNASGGTILAARKALETGIGINIGGGYHHAKPDRGEGFCLYADVPIAIRKLQKEGLIQRAVVIDVDVHQGNGTIVCLDDDTTFTFSMHQRGIYPIPKERGDLDVELRSGLNDQQYQQILDKHLPDVLNDSRADICFIVAGCDTLKGDPLASLNMTHQGIVKRDHAIVDACVQRKIPVVLTLSGGYSPDAWKAQYLSIKRLIETYQLSPHKTVRSQPTETQPAVRSQPQDLPSTKVPDKKDLEKKTDPFPRHDR